MLAALRRGQVFARDARAALLHRGVQPAGKVALAKARLHRAVDDARGGDVGYGAFQRLGHLDAHAPVVLGHDHQHAIAHVLAADLPGVAHAVGEGGDVLGRGGGHHQHPPLRAVLLLYALTSFFTVHALIDELVAAANATPAAAPQRVF